jgi:hypothetical protein
MPLRQMSRLLHLSRNTLRRLLRNPAPSAATPEPPADPTTLAQVQAAFTRCRGNVVRVQEVLAAEHGLALPYSTLTRWVRLAGLRAPARRVGAYPLAPGEEMQHDTSAHRVPLAGNTVLAQCIALALGHSRWLFFTYAPRFTRFEAKAFFAEAFAAIDGTCPRCLIDNTSVLVAAGAGPEATIAPEMAAFGRAYGVTFRPHRVGDPDRKGYVNPLRPDAYVRTPFLDFLLAATQEPDAPYVAVLDEMKLSHPEQYLAPLLSAMETGAAIDLHREGELLDGVPPSLPYPTNLVLIGTVNMDETTHGLSDKVLDRAFTFEFLDIDLAAYPRWGSRGLSHDTEQSARAALEAMMVALRPARLHFGWRLVDGYSTFSHAASKPGRYSLRSMRSTVSCTPSSCRSCAGKTPCVPARLFRHAGAF